MQDIRPKDVSAEAWPGTSGHKANADHQHQGIHALFAGTEYVLGDPELLGNAYIGISVTTDGDIQFTVDPSAIVTAAVVDAAGAVMETDFNAHTILAADVDDTPLPLDVGTDTILGRPSGSPDNIAALTPAQVRSMINVEDGADVTDTANVDAAGAVMETDFNESTVLVADVDDTPTALVMGADTILGRESGSPNPISALTPAQVRDMIAVGTEEEFLALISSLHHDMLPGKDMIHAPTHEDGGSDALTGANVEGIVRAALAAATGAVTLNDQTLSDTGAATIGGAADVTQLIVKANAAQSIGTPLLQLQASDGTPLLDITSNDPTNIFIGVDADGATTSGVRNVVVGHQAGRLGTEGSYNVFMGYEAGEKTVTGGSNVFLGYTAGKESTGSSNVAVGSGAGSNMTSGAQNTLVGWGVGSSLGTGQRNTMLGYSAGSACTDDYNVFLGYRAGRLSTSGTSGVFIGADAGENNTTGDQNVFIGREAGHAATTGAASVFLGYQAGYYETAGSKLFIDNAARASEADARVKALIYGIFDAATANQILLVNGELQVREGLVFTDGGSTVDIIRDEDDMVSDDNEALATQQSIKAYVDDSVSGASNAPLIRKDADEAITDDNTMQDDDELEFTVVAGEEWHFDINVRVRANGTNCGIDFQMNGPAFDAGEMWYAGILRPVLNLVAPDNGVVVTAWNTDCIAKVLNGDVTYLAHVWGSVKTNANGTVVLRWAPHGTTGTATVYKGGTLRAWKE